MREKECGFSLIELMIVVAIMGILVAIALPQYQNYQVRSRVTEALVLSTSVKRALESYYADHGEWPLLAQEAGLPALPTDFNSTYIKSVKVADGQCGIFNMKFRWLPKLGVLQGGHLWLKPTVPTDGGPITWYCGVDAFARRKVAVPSECKNPRDRVCP
jgi:type IV pilus assembly protein PilA